ncbi:hypothetical protein [Nodosilinea sp. P-1105]|uniref:hypothetical protein n=1 Tax=Nodosilinea sp. P-1105 TaxID=2546229 RepID=UPI00146D6682|nr:hypothetical protein [Nodosilinea sp. P-1105]NMF83206.1 hypothetical protein [Nodosilinea sp. P-1105]
MRTNHNKNDSNIDDRTDREFVDSIQTRPVTPDEVAYRDGYVHGMSAEQTQQRQLRDRDARFYEQEAQARASNGAASGVFIGFLLALIAAVVGGIAFLAMDSGNPGDPGTTEPPTSEAPTQDTTIIDRTIDRTQEIVPIPVTPTQSNTPDQAQPETTTPESNPESNAATADDPAEPAAQGTSAE